MKHPGPTLACRADRNRLGLLQSLPAGLEAARETLQLDPDSQFSYQVLAQSFMRLNRFDEAKSVRESQIDQGIEDWGAHLDLYRIAFVQGDREAMERHADWIAGTSEEHVLLSVQASAAAFSGRLQEARRLRGRAVVLAQQRNLEAWAATLAAEGALTESELGNSRQAHEQATEALSRATVDAQTIAALALARAGDSTRALALADEVSREFPNSTLHKAVFLPLIRAVIEIRRGNPSEAIEFLQMAERYELGEGSFDAIFTRGQAYLDAGLGPHAVAEFRKILEHRGAGPVSPLYPLAHLGLARASVLVGDLAEARRAYQDFFALWKDADPDVPALQQAQVEYSKLS